MNIIKEKFYLYKQRECIRAIIFVIDGHSQYVYNTANNFLNYHKQFLSIDDKHFVNDPLITLKHFYYKDLLYRRELLKTSSEEDFEEIQKIIDGDIQILDDLTDEFMNTYYKVISNIKYVEFNKKYLNEEQKNLFLTKFYNAINLDNDVDKIKAKKVN